MSNYEDRRIPCIQLAESAEEMSLEVSIDLAPQNYSDLASWVGVAQPQRAISRNIRQRLHWRDRPKKANIPF